MLAASMRIMTSTQSPCVTVLRLAMSLAVNALVERQIGAGALGRDHEDGRRVVGQHNLRAGAGQSAADAGAESAQAFKSRRSAGGQRGRQAGNLRGGRLAGGESSRADSCRCCRAENGCADRIGPHDAGRIRAPKPSRQGARRQRRKPTVPQVRQLEPGNAHVRGHTPRSGEKRRCPQHISHDF